MKFKTDDEILREQIQLIIDDVIDAYRSSGKKVSGDFEKGLELIQEPQKATIRGFVYLAGRGASKAGNKGEPKLSERLLEWIKKRGIRPRNPKTSLKTLAFLMARKIHRQGTDKNREFKIYESVITQDRIISIIDLISEVNANRIITEISLQLEVIAKNV